MNRLLTLLLGLGLATVLPAQSLVDLVNPLMGTDSDFSLSHGNTYPAIARPWGMNFWTPQTGEMGDGWAYSYDAKRIRGIKQTHQPSPWINDYAAFAFMAGTGPVRFDETERASWFSHKAEVVQPHYYRVYLADYDVTAEVTPTERAAVFRFTFPAADTAWILLDAFEGGSEVRIDPARRRITGYCRNHHGGVPRNFHNYFVAEFDHEVLFTHTWHDSTLVPGGREETGDHVGLVVGLRTAPGTVVQVRVASSFISPEQAQRNLDQEIRGRDFEAVAAEGRAQWEAELGRIRVSGGSLAEQQTFYSCLYRVLLFPRAFYEYDADSQVVHYSPYNGEVRPGYLYTDNGFWDTFRAVFPFFTLMYPELNSRIMEGLVHTYEESGWLPEWASPGHRDCMIGSNSASIIADAYLKGIRGYDIDKLYEAILKNTESVGPVSSVGRYGAEYYNELGYVPYDAGIRENTARTLEYAYADFTIMRLAEALGRPAKEVKRFAERAQNYRHVFDPETRLMRGKNQDGTFQAPFNPFKWGDAFTEGNSWHYTWSVFHDVAGLMDLMGGEAAFGTMLDSVFRMRPVFDDSYYGFPIHEIREMQIMNMGQYAHGNQPIQHMVYLYPYAGQAWKTQARVREVMAKLYSPLPDGYCGDEDNGQTSAWYVFSALGFYPVCPGTPQYVIGSPLFQKAVLQMPGGRVLTIEAPDNGPEHLYIQSARFNGAPYSRHWLDHHDLQAGGHLYLEMGPSPETGRGLAPADRPWSMSP